MIPLGLHFAFPVSAIRQAFKSPSITVRISLIFFRNYRVNFLF